MSSPVRGGQRVDNPGGQSPETFPLSLISLACLLPGPEVVRPFLLRVLVSYYWIFSIDVNLNPRSSSTNLSNPLHAQLIPLGNADHSFTSHFSNGLELPELLGGQHMPICFSGFWSWRDLMKHLVQPLCFSEKLKAHEGKWLNLRSLSQFMKELTPCVWICTRTVILTL